MEDTPLISVIVLSYNRPQYLVHALESIVAQSYKNLELIVVDNHSERTQEVVRLVKAFPEARLVCNSANVGFTGGMNTGLRLASGRYVLLTEDDIILDPHCVERLSEYLNTDPQAGLASGVMYNCSDQKIRCAGGLVVLGSTYRKTIYGAGQRDTGQFREPFEVNYIPGAFIIARTDVLQALGGFRESFFMYFEDTDLCLRVQRMGYRIVVVPTAKVQHWDPTENNPVDWIEVHKVKNFLSVYTLHARFRVLPVFFLRYVAIDLAKNLFRDPRRARSLWLGMCRYLPLIPTLMRQRYAQ